MELSSISIAITSLVSALFSPGAIFTTGVNGAWYDPSDFSTMFQDAAGTTPVTAVGQPVGLMLDKSGRSNHAFNPSGNSANFPVLSARYNLLTKTEQFDDAVWSKGNSTITANNITAPDGLISADKIVETTTPTVQHFVQQTYGVVSGTQYVFTVYAKSAERDNIKLQFNPSAFGVFVQYRFTLSGSGSVTTILAGTNSSATITNVGSGWYRCVISAQATITASSQCVMMLYNAENQDIYTGDGTSGLYVWGADLRISNDALNQPAYQRVNTATDYDTVGFKPYLSFNGVNQWLQTNSIDFSYGDKMFVCAGFRKLSDATIGVIAEISAGDAPGSCQMYGYVSAYTFASIGTAGSSAVASGYPSPITNVISGIGNISGDQAILRANGTQVAQSTAMQGTGNYGNYPLYIGARAGSSLFFNGRLYQLIVADGGYNQYALEDDNLFLLEDGTAMLTEYGANPVPTVIAAVESFVNQKTGAY